MRLWDVETGACVKTLEGHGHDVNSVCFSPDGKQVASVSNMSAPKCFYLNGRQAMGGWAPGQR